MDPGVSRRNFIKYSGVAGAAGLTGCMHGGGGEDGEGERPVTWIGPEYASYDEQVAKYEEMTGISLETTHADLPTVQERIIGGENETFDAVSVDTSSAGALTLDNDVTEQVPAEDLPDWDEENISDVFTEPEERLSHIGAQAEKLNEQLWMDSDAQENLRFPPTVYNFDAIGYNPEQIEPGSVSEWSALFDDEYQGQVLFDAIPAIGIPETLMHLLDNDMVDAEVGELNDPSQDQMDAAIDFLIDQKEAGQFRSTWTAYGTSVDLMASEEAIVGDIWQPAAMDVRREGTPCKYATMSEGVQGYRFWYAGIIPTNPGARDRNNWDEVTTLINDVHYGAWYPGFIQEFGYSTPHYPNTELVRDGSDDSGEGMGPEYYDWAFEGEATYEAVDDPYLFDPREYEWSDEEGEPHEDGQVRDSGPIEERFDRTSFFQIWPSEADYMLDRWDEFTAA